MNYSVIYTSSTGNTKMLAETIFNFLPKNKLLKTMNEITKYDIDNSDIIFLGYWVDKSTCNNETIDFIQSLENKNIAAFGTMGMGNIPEYTKQVLNNVEQLFSRNIFLGSFMCVGKMKPCVREKYMKLLEKNPNDSTIKELINNFDNTITHPDEIDLENVKKFVSEIIQSF